MAKSPARKILETAEKTFGRPSKLTPDVEAKVCQAIRAGNYIETAAAYAGVSKDTLYAWLKRGASVRSGPYRHFSDAVSAALATAEVSAVAAVAKGAGKDWRAAAWMLERTRPERFGPRQRLDIGGAEGAPPIGVQVYLPAEDPADDPGRPPTPPPVSGER